MLAADVDECGGGDQFVAALLRVVPLEGGEQPIGEIGGPGGAGGQKELDDPPLGYGNDSVRKGKQTPTRLRATGG